MAVKDEQTTKWHQKLPNVSSETRRNLCPKLFAAAKTCRKGDMVAQNMAPGQRNTMPVKDGEATKKRRKSPYRTLPARRKSALFRSMCLTSGILEPSNLHLPKPSDLVPSQVFLCALDMSFFPDFWQHRQKRAAESFNTGALTDRHFYTKKSLHRELLRTEAFTHRSFYTEKSLHREAFTRRSFFTQKFLHREAVTQRSFYTQGRLHTDAVTQRSLYTESFNTQARLHTETFPQRSLYRESFYTRKLSHT